MAYPNDLPTYHLSDDEASALKGLVEAALKETSLLVEPWVRIFADMYTGRDPSTGIGTSAVALANPDDANNTITLDLGGTGLPGDSSVRLPKAAANLVLSRIRQRVIATTPGVPRFDVTALVDGGVRLAEDQAALFDVIIPNTGIESQMERVAFLLPTQCYVGLRLLTNHDAAFPHQAVGWEAVDATHCGYEPFLHRFNWWTYSTQFGALPDDVQTFLTRGMSDVDQPEPWALVGVTEVYHQGLAFDSNRHTGYEVPASMFVRLEGDVWHGRRVNPELGEYVHTMMLRGPVLAIERGLDPAPNEDVAMPEVLSWLPLMRSIGIVIDMIMSEVQNQNTTILYDKEALGTVVKQLINVRPGQTVYLPVHVDDGDTRGVNATMRPVERNSTLPDLINTLNILLALFDDVSGVGPVDRGAAVNPEKSATEASALVNASGRRNTDAIRVQARLWATGGTMFMLHQRDLLGERIRIPQKGNIIRDMLVPDPKNTPLNLRVDPTSFENQGRQGKIDTEMLVITTLTNVAASLQNPNALRMVNEALRRFLKAVGWKDGDDYMATSADPIARYVDALETGQPIPVLGDDNHAAYIAGYQSILERGMDATRDVDVGMVTDALQRHQVLFAEASQATRLSPVPGMASNGALDNQIAGATAAGGVPALTKQQLG
jgi:hypothetical protein